MNKYPLNSRLVIGLGVLCLLLFAAIFASVLSPWDPLDQDLMGQYLPPFWIDKANSDYLMGTDALGRDVLSRLIYGAQPALIVALLGASFSALIGIFLGLVAGFYGGWIDSLISRTVEIFMSFPPVLLAIVLVAVIGNGLHAVIIAIVIIDWTRFCRVVRSEVLVLRELDFVSAARTIGKSRRQILFGEILPNVAPLMLVLFALEMGIAITVEAILSFVGFSSSNIATWGGMIAEGREYLHQAWWVMTLPIGCIIVSVLGLNLLGDGLRQTFDPLLRK
ncbi:MAG: ABC transporter permease [Pseudomonadota bacterium]|nr:ABC transporter permease [Pseudomonadota bacterium]